MKKIFNVIGICALISYLFIFPSCEESYDEDELLRDIEKKKNENKKIEEAQKALIEAQKTFIIDFEGDTFTLPAKVLPVYIESPYTAYGYKGVYSYIFDISDKEVIMKSLFEQTAKISKIGNILLTPDRIFPKSINISDVLINFSDVLEENYWQYVISENDFIRKIRFSFEGDKASFIIDHDNFLGERKSDENENKWDFINIPYIFVPNGLDDIHDIFVND